MLNQIVIVGRLANDLEIRKNENGEEMAIATLAVPRTFKNKNGEYETDFIDCILWNAIVKNTAEYCSKGDVIGIRGRVQSRTIENEDGAKNRIMEIVADKVTFLSSKKPETGDDLSA